MNANFVLQTVLKRILLKFNGSVVKGFETNILFFLLNFVLFKTVTIDNTRYADMYSALQ